jgi:hypothetical protein
MTIRVSTRALGALLIPMLITGCSTVSAEGRVFSTIHPTCRRVPTPSEAWGG